MRLVDRRDAELMEATRKEWEEANVIERSLFHHRLFSYCVHNNEDFKAVCDRLGIEMIKIKD